MSMNGVTRFLPFTGRLLIGGIFLDNRAGR